MAQLKRSLDNIVTVTADQSINEPLRQERDLLEEILQLVRQQTRDAAGYKEKESKLSKRNEIFLKITKTIKIFFCSKSQFDRR